MNETSVSKGEHWPNNRTQSRGKILNVLDTGKARQGTSDLLFHFMREKSRESVSPNGLGGIRGLTAYRGYATSVPHAPSAADAFMASFERHERRLFRLHFAVFGILLFAKSIYNIRVRPCTHRDRKEGRKVAC